MTKISGLLVSFSFAILVIGCGGGSSAPPPPTPTPTPQLTVTPGSATVAIGGSKAFSVLNTTAPITWTVSGPGSISSTGVYLAPSTFPTPNTATITATSGSQTGTAAVSVVFPNDNAGNQAIPIKLGTSGGNIFDNSTDQKSCCIGTLGSLWSQGGSQFILSNNHVLARSDQGKTGEAIDQPGEVGCPPGSQGANVGTLSQAVVLKPTAGSDPSDCRGVNTPLCGFAQHNVDAALAKVLPGTVDPSGNILDLGAAGSTSIAAAPPLSVLPGPGVFPSPGQGVAKSGRTTGLTCSTVLASRTNFRVDYESSCGGPVAFTAVYQNQVVISGGNFSAGGDSGSLVVTSDTAQPVALLFAGDTASTIANPIQDVVTQLTNANGAPAIVGTPTPHSISCAPTTQSQSLPVGAQSARVSASQLKLAQSVRGKVAPGLMRSEPSIQSIGAGGSADSPEDGALIIKVTKVPQTRIPPVIEGMRTRVVFPEGTVSPVLGRQEFDRASAVKEARTHDYMGKNWVRGIGVGRSDDNPAEGAIVIFTLRGAPHPRIPATIDGIRTKVIEGERFRAFDWNSQLEPKVGACSKGLTPKK